MAQCFQMLSEKHCWARILHAAELYFRSEGKIETFSDEGRLIGFVTERPMQKMSKGSAQHMRDSKRRNLGTSERKHGEQNVGEQDKLSISS